MPADLATVSRAEGGRLSPAYSPVTFRTTNGTPVESTLGHRPADDVRPPATAGPPRAPWRVARLAVAGLVACAVINVLNTLIAVADYEDKIIVVTHGEPDVVGLLEVLDLLAPLDVLTMVGARLWMLGLFVTVVAFITWLFQARRNAGRLRGGPKWAPGWAIGGWFIPVANLVIPYKVVQDVQKASSPYVPGQPPVTVRTAPVGLWWAGWIVTVVLNRVIAAHHAVALGDEIYVDERLAARPVTYLLLSAGTVALVATAVLGVLVVLRITAAQQQTAQAAAV